MSAEIEAAATGGLGGFFRFKASKSDHFEPGASCANCATPLLGPWCYHCGQSGEEFHRSIFKLLGEVFEGLLHFDGRVWRTLPDLFRRPGHLTRSFLNGHRAPQIPPLRLFLVVLLLIFLAGSLGGRAVHINTTIKDDKGKVLAEKIRSINSMSDLTPEERAKAKAALEKLDIHVSLGKDSPAAAVWLKTRVGQALEDPERFKLVLEQWSERFAFLTLPLAATLLSLLFIFQRQFYIFDHTIFSLHSLSAVGLILAVAIGFSGLTHGVSQHLVWAAPAHLFFHMRGVYKTSILGTLLRMWLLFCGSLIGGTLIFLGLLWVGLSGMGE
jgi:hypothetical protein